MSDRQFQRLRAENHTTEAQRLAGQYSHVILDEIVGQSRFSQILGVYVSSGTIQQATSEDQRAIAHSSGGSEVLRHVKHHI